MCLVDEPVVSYLLGLETPLTTLLLLVWRSHFGGTELISLERNAGTAPIIS